MLFRPATSISCLRLVFVGAAIALAGSAGGLWSADAAAPGGAAPELAPGGPPSGAPAARLSDPKLIAMAVRTNFRLIDAAAWQFALDKGRWPKDVDAIVAERGGYYLKPIRPVDGESYNKLDLGPDGLLWTVTTASGMTVTFERKL